MTSNMRHVLSLVSTRPYHRSTICPWAARALAKRGFVQIDRHDIVSITEAGERVLGCGVKLEERGVERGHWRTALAACSELVAAIAAERAPANDAYLSTTEAARIASVTPATIRRWVRQKKLKRHEAGGRVRVKRDELERLMTPAGKETAAERAKRRLGA